MPRLALPKGSLERATLELFEAADLTVERASTVEYRATIADPRVDEVRILRPQEIPAYVAEGLFDVGISGRDWVEETASDVVSLGELRYSKATSIPCAWSSRSPLTRRRGASATPPGLRVSSEYPELTRRYFEDRGIAADIRLSYGARRRRCLTSPTASSTSPRPVVRCAPGLRVIDTILTSYTEVVANRDSYADPAKRHAMGQLMTLLNGALEACTKALLKLNAWADHFEAVLAVLPSAKSPTISELAGGGIRRGERRREAPDQPRDPGPQGRRRHRSPRDPDRQDRPLSRNDGLARSEDSARSAGPGKAGLWCHARCVTNARGLGTLSERGVVVDFDEHVGLGHVETDAGDRYLFHCVEIADGTRSIAVGAAVEFDLMVKLGRARGSRSTPSHVSDFDVRVTAVLLALGDGEVTTYGDYRAEVAGYPHCSSCRRCTAGGGRRRRPAVVACRVQRRPVGRPTVVGPGRAAACRGRHGDRRPGARRSGRAVPPGQLVVGRGPGLDLDERQADVAQRVADRHGLGAQAVTQPVDQTGHCVDGQRRRRQVRIGRRQVNGGQLVQAHDVVRHDDLGRHFGDSPASILDCRLGLGQLVRRSLFGIDARLVARFVGHLRYPNGPFRSEVGATPTRPPAVRRLQRLRVMVRPSVGRLRGLACRAPTETPDRETSPIAQE